MSKAGDTMAMHELNCWSRWKRRRRSARGIAVRRGYAARLPSRRNPFALLLFRPPPPPPTPPPPPPPVCTIGINAGSSPVLEAYSSATPHSASRSSLCGKSSTIHSVTIATLDTVNSRVWKSTGADVPCFWLQLLSAKYRNSYLGRRKRRRRRRRKNRS